MNILRERLVSKFVLLYVYVAMGMSTALGAADQETINLTISTIKDSSDLSTTILFRPGSNCRLGDGFSIFEAIAGDGSQIFTEPVVESDSVDTENLNHFDAVVAMTTNREEAKRTLDSMVSGSGAWAKFTASGSVHWTKYIENVDEYVYLFVRASRLGKRESIRASTDGAFHLTEKSITDLGNLNKFAMIHGDHYIREITYGAELIGVIKIHVSNATERRTFAGNAEGSFLKIFSGAAETSNFIQKSIKNRSVEGEIRMDGADHPILPESVDNIKAAFEQFASTNLQYNSVKVQALAYPVSSLGEYIRNLPNQVRPLTRVAAAIELIKLKSLQRRIQTAIESLNYINEHLEAFPEIDATKISADDGTQLSLTQFFDELLKQRSRLDELVNVVRSDPFKSSYDVVDRWLFDNAVRIARWERTPLTYSGTGTIHVKQLAKVVDGMGPAAQVGELYDGRVPLNFSFKYGLEQKGSSAILNYEYKVGMHSKSFYIGGVTLGSKGEASFKPFDEVLEWKSVKTYSPNETFQQSARPAAAAPVVRTWQPVKPTPGWTYLQLNVSRPEVDLGYTGIVGDFEVEYVVSIPFKGVSELLTKTFDESRLPLL